MKRKIMGIICLLILAAVLLSCSGESGTGTDTSEESTVPEVQLISLAEYKIIRPDDQDEYTEAAKAVYTAMLAEFGNAQITVDFYKRTETLPEKAKEILIGPTNRPESSENSGSLKTLDWRVEYHPESERISILGGSQAALTEAVEWFIETYVKGKKTEAAVPSDLLKIYSSDSYQYKSLKINGASIEDYSIVIPSSADKDEIYAANCIKNTIETKTGICMNIVSENKYESGKAFFIGNTKKLKNAGLTAAVAATVSVSEDNIFIFGEGGYEVAAAKRLIDSVFENKTGEDISVEIKENMVYEGITANVGSVSEFGTLPVAIVDQKNACAAIYDLSSVYKAAISGGSALPELKYTFKPSSAKGFTVDSTYANRIDEFRIRYSELLGCYLMLFTSSSGFTGIAKYPSGDKVWEKSLSGYGPHSIEYLPNGFVALALSGNGDETKAQVRLYDTNGKITQNSYSLVEGCHAVLWDEVRSILWVYGTNDLFAYEAEAVEGKPVLTKIDSYSFSYQGLGGHDMSAVPGDSDRLIISGTKGAVIVNKPLSKSEILAEKQLNINATKCLSLLPALAGDAGSRNPGFFFIRTYAQNVYASHDTDNFDIFWGTSLDKAPSGSFKVTLSDRAFYKARAIDYSYCPNLP